METRLADLTVREFKQLISEVIDEKISEINDPDHGLELRVDFREMLTQQAKDYEAGKLTTVSFDEVLTSLGIDRSELETETNVSDTVS